MNDARPTPESAIADWQRVTRGRATPREREIALEGVNAAFAAEAERIYAYCRRRVRDTERARELAQDVQLTAWSRLDDFDTSARFSSWLYGIAGFVCLRARARKRDLLSTDGVLDPADARKGALSSVLRAEREAVLERTMQGLDAQTQEALYFRYVMQHSRAEIAALLGMTSPTGVNGVLYRGMKHLKEVLPAVLEELGHGTSFLSSRT